MELEIKKKEGNVGIGSFSRTHEVYLNGVKLGKGVTNVTLTLPAIGNPRIKIEGDVTKMDVDLMEEKQTLEEIVGQFISDTLRMEETKENPAMVAAIAELYNSTFNY
ncbi:hypothetical protein [Lactococcus ileimucosae]|uniref:hypothetical protein n=1 Tax=Lactococcus ileimucosae TaxID=2941329 RepID=UPI003513EC6F